MLDSGLLRVCSRGKKLRIWAEFCVERQHYGEIFIALEGLRFGEEFEVTFRRGLREKHAVQSGFCILSHYLFYDGGKLR